MAGTDDFFVVLQNYRKLSVWAAGGSVAVPFVAQFIGVVPPFPTGLNVISAVLQLVVLMIMFQLYRRKPRALINRRMPLFAALALAALLVYLFAFGILVVEGPGTERYAIGLQCTEAARLVHGESCPFLGAGALAGAAWDEFLLWTRWSVSLVRLLLVGLWFAFFGFLAAAIGVFLVYQGDAGARRAAPKPQG